MCFLFPYDSSTLLSTFSLILSLVDIPNCHTLFQTQIDSEKEHFWKFSKLVCGWLTRRNVPDCFMFSKWHTNAGKIN